MFDLPGKSLMPSAKAALAGREQPLLIDNVHYVNGRNLQPPFPDGMQPLLLGLGCFWGAERLFWSIPGVYSTAVGYAGGFTLNPTYNEVCSGMTGHTEVVLVVYDSSIVSLETLLKVFWEAHDPTQGMRQGNDIGTQYRSAIYCSNSEQLRIALESKALYTQSLKDSGCGAITTEITADKTLYYAEGDHQQYLAKNPNGYCGLSGTGVTCPAL